MSLTLDQAKRVVAVAPIDSYYYHEALRVLQAAGYYGTPAPVAVDKAARPLEGPGAPL
jgi:hypothetical protein